MPTLLQINTTLNYGAPGRIAEYIGLLAKDMGWRSVISHGPRMKNPSQLDTYQINSELDEKIHGGLYTLFLDRHGLGSKKATKRFIEFIKNDVKPDIIHLHNIHGYYLNYELFFNFLKTINTPIVWTLHDCWNFTGHCVYFDAIGCDKWKKECHHCPQKTKYPYSIFIDNSRNNFQLKKQLFTAIEDRIIAVPVSYFLGDYVRESFLGKCDIQVIHNGIDLNTFKPSDSKKNNNKNIILGVASPWNERKGLNDFVKLRELLSEETFEIRLIGLSKKQLMDLPDGIVGIEKTQNVYQLVEEYSNASVFVNPTYEDNYPTTNLEAMACGTPVITYNTGGSPESIDEKTGLVVEKGNIPGLVTGITDILSNKNLYTVKLCRERALKEFDAPTQFAEYLALYDTLLSK